MLGLQAAEAAPGARRGERPSRGRNAKQQRREPLNRPLPPAAGLFPFITSPPPRARASFRREPALPGRFAASALRRRRRSRRAGRAPGAGGPGWAVLSGVRPGSPEPAREPPAVRPRFVTRGAEVGRGSAGRRRRPARPWAAAPPRGPAGSPPRVAGFRAGPKETKPRLHVVFMMSENSFSVANADSLSMPRPSGSCGHEGTWNAREIRVMRTTGPRAEPARCGARQRDQEGKRWKREREGEILHQRIHLSDAYNSQVRASPEARARNFIWSPTDQMSCTSHICDQVEAEGRILELKLQTAKHCHLGGAWRRQGLEHREPGGPYFVPDQRVSCSIFESSNLMSALVLL
ncbi:uncharacterized protein LOC133775053 [Lepus europaeus]|uniref:uncharacterized protein LOC133775053 n=1 Tax=Lepus europaeus TaxID=9983 RepID=UPI002B48960E|nr:uncharacterized protein LOC133775053 [Lepus europaeus]